MKRVNNSQQPTSVARYTNPAIIKNRNSKQAGVSRTRDELNNLLLVYYMIRDCIAGEPAIKGLINYGYGVTPRNMDSGTFMIFNNVVLSRARRYLPMPNEEDQSKRNLDRYRAYVTRAVFYNVTGRTLDGMVGQIFLRQPEITVPDLLNVMLTNSDGGGLSLEQLAKRAARHTLAYGRCGLFIDYPVTDGPTTKAQLENGDIQPLFTVYNPWDIINWRTMQRGAKRLLNLVVIRETFLGEAEDTGFEVAPFEQYRVLRLNGDTPTIVQTPDGGLVNVPPGAYYVEIHSSGDKQPMKEGIPGQSNYKLSESYVPVDSDGQPFDEIPFIFIGSENNDTSPDRPPLYDLASVNIGHYRNSADFEEASFICGQPTPVASGLSEDWVSKVLKDTLTLGSRAGIPLPVGAKAELLQASANNMPLEAMKRKEEQMVALGAKLVEQKASISSRRTATELVIDTVSESCTLKNVADNVSSAITKGLQWAATFVGATEDIVFKLNTDFELIKMSPQDQLAIVQQWQTGAICWSEMRSALRKAGTATLEDDQAKEEIKAEQAEMMAGQIPTPEPQPKGQPEPTAANA